MPWKGKSIVGISSKTSVCFFLNSFFFKRQFFFFVLFSSLFLSRLSYLTSFSGGIALRASQSQAPLPIEVAPDCAEAEALVSVICFFLKTKETKFCL